MKSDNGFRPKDPLEVPATRAQIGYLIGLHRQLGSDMPDVTSKAGAAAAIEQAKQRLASALPPATEPGPTDTQLHDLKVLARRLDREPPAVETVSAASTALAQMRRELDDRSAA